MISFRATKTRHTGLHTGRARYHVECLDCGEVLHDMTTGPYQVVEMHLREKHYTVEIVDEPAELPAARVLR